MTKKEIHKEINSRFYSYVNGNFPQYQIDNSEGYGRVYLVANNSDDSIEYHQSRHDLCQMNWASAESKKDVEIMEVFLNDLLKQYSL
jgi:hypothetical protein